MNTRVRLLIVDDDLKWISAIRPDFDEAGVFELRVENTTVDANNVLAHWVPDVLLVDRKLKSIITDASGQHFANELLARPEMQRCVIILVTDQFTSETAKEYTEVHGPSGLRAWAKESSTLLLLGLIILGLREKRDQATQQHEDT